MLRARDGVRWIAILAATTYAVAPALGGEGGPEDRVTVVFVDRMINAGEASVTDVQVALVCPPNTPAQTIHSFELQPAPSRIEIDQWGQSIAIFRVDELRPGEQLVVRSITDATLRPWQIDLASVQAGAEGEIPEDIRDLYLRDTEKYALDSDEVRSAVEEILAARAGRPEPDMVGTIGAAFDHVVDRLKYVRDGTWDAADEVMERGSGSCSEYVFAFIALCRACGIPARYVGGNARRSGAQFHIDRVSHRWAEAYLPGVGWVPFDPTRSDGKDRHRRFFGRSPDNVLALARGDGGPDSAIRWRYESYHTWAGPENTVGVHRRGWWFGRVPDEVRSPVMAIADAICRARDAELKRGLLRKARSIGHRFSLPWLEDFLYDPDLRYEAAEATREIGGPTAAIPLIDCLGRAGDPSGDTAIGWLLDEWTGERLGGSRSNWQAWLGTKAFAEFRGRGEAEPEL